MADQSLYADPDDAVHDVHAEWLGPRGKTLPWAARYQTYALGLGVYLGLLLVEFVTGLHFVGWPVTEIGVTFFICFGLMKIVDYERPLKAHVPTFLAEARRTRRSPRTVRLSLVLRVERGHRRNRWAGWLASRRKPPADPPAPSAPAKPVRASGSRQVRVEKARHRYDRCTGSAVRVVALPFRMLHASPADMAFVIVGLGFAVACVCIWALEEFGGLAPHVVQ